MKKDIFESKFEVLSNLKEKPITLIPYFIGIGLFGLVLIGISLWSDGIVDNFHQERTDAEIQAVLDDSTVLDISDLKTATFVASDEMLGQGKDIVLTNLSATDVVDSSLILGAGNSYRFNNTVAPGVYTVNYSLDSELVFGEFDDLSYEGYLLGSESYGYLPNTFYNVAIDGNAQLFIESEYDDFELQFTPQDSYHMFDSDNIQNGVYVAGQSIEPGEYKFWSTSDIETWVQLQTEDGVEYVHSGDQDTFNIKPGDSLVIETLDIGMNKVS